MQKGFLESTIFQQELKATKLFLFLYFVLYLFIDVIFAQIVGIFNGNRLTWIEAILFISECILQIILLISAFVLLKREKPWLIKYVFLLSYILFSTFSDVTIYYHLNETLNRGGIIELYFILFAPIFVNRRFYWTACGACLAKYIYLGAVFQTAEVLVPLGIIVVFTVMSYILLMRFITYVDAIRSSFSSQLEAVVKGAVASLELKDRYTKGHSDRVAVYSVIIAKELKKFSRHELDIFYYSCLLHDVGKVQIPDRILCKEGPLTKEEYELIQTHPSIGADTMESIEGLVMNFEVIRYHHERWDGTGYPEGLKKDETPLLARIASIADAFDAMTSIRSYRKALPPEEAYRRIVEQSGKQFDPALVHVFQRCFPKIIEHYQSCNPHFPETI